MNMIFVLQTAMMFFRFRTEINCCPLVSDCHEWFWSKNLSIEPSKMFLGDLSFAFCRTLMSDLGVILDEEAESFVVKLWRLLHYETQAKKLGLPSQP